MVVSRCIMECLSFHAFLLILWSLDNFDSPISESWVLILKPWLLIYVNKQRKQNNTRATHFTEIVYLKQRQEDMLSLVFKKLNLCPVMPAFRGVNPLTTSHTAEHLSSIWLYSWSQDNPILYLITHCSNKKALLGNPDNHKKNLILQKKVIYFRLYLGNVTFQDVK